MMLDLLCTQVKPDKLWMSQICCLCDLRVRVDARVWAFKFLNNLELLFQQAKSSFNKYWWCSSFVQVWFLLNQNHFCSDLDISQYCALKNSSYSTPCVHFLLWNVCPWMPTSLGCVCVFVWVASVKFQTSAENWVSFIFVFLFFFLLKKSYIYFVLILLKRILWIGILINKMQHQKKDIPIHFLMPGLRLNNCHLSMPVLQSSK